MSCEHKFGKYVFVLKRRDETKLFIALLVKYLKSLLMIVLYVAGTPLPKTLKHIKTISGVIFGRIRIRNQ